MLKQQNQYNQQNINQQSESHQLLLKLQKKLKRNQQLLEQTIKQVGHKVNKNQFISALSSKVSISQFAKYNLPSKEQHLVSQPNLTITPSIPIIQSFIMQQIAPLTILTKSLKQTQATLEDNQLHLENNYEELLTKQLKLKRQVQCMIHNKMATKTDRTQFDKVMHLTSLLAIELQQIKDRFQERQTEIRRLWKVVQEGKEEELSGSQQRSQQLSQQYKSRQTKRTQRQNSKDFRLYIVDENQNQYPSKDQQKKYNSTKYNSSNEMAPVQHFTQLQTNKKTQQLSKSLEQYNTANHLYFQELTNKLKSQQLTNSSLSSQIDTLKSQFTFLESNLTTKIQSLQFTLQNISQSHNNFNQILSSNTSTTNEFHIQLTQQLNQTRQQLTEGLKNITKSTKKQEQQQHRQLSYLRKQQDQLECMWESQIKRVAKLQQGLDRVGKDVKVSVGVVDDKIGKIGRELMGRVKVEEMKKHTEKYAESSKISDQIMKVEKSLSTNLDSFKKDQQELNTIICSENVVAKWLWTSNSLQNGNLVPWNKPLINTLPQNYIYNPQQTTIQITNSGIYKIQISFYCKKKPSIQLLVDGQTVISAVNNSSYVLHHSSGKLKDVSVCGEVIGVGFVDFLRVGEGSRLAVSFVGEPVGQGFVCLQRV